METNVIIREQHEQTVKEFFESHDFYVEQASDTVIQVNKSGDLPVYISIGEEALFFEVDLGNITEIGSLDLYYRLLDLNTEILPVSVGVNSSHPDDPRLVLLESRERANLDANELLSVMNALEIASVKVEILLSEFMK